MEFGDQQEYATDPGVLLNLDFRGEHWDGDHEHDVLIQVEGLWARLADVIDFSKHIGDWVRLSMVNLDPTQLDRKFRFCRLPGQQLDFEFGSVPEVISGMNPVITITFAAGKLNGSFRMVVDQSCLNLFATDLSACIESVTE